MRIFLQAYDFHFEHKSTSLRLQEIVYLIFLYLHELNQSCLYTYFEYC
nr:MAG TPA: hypothetical protein [Caudoviricetes sp.]